MDHMRNGMQIECANVRCRKTFTIGDRNDGRIDKRERFCCAACEKQYWRDVTRHPKPERVTHLQQFHSAEEYASYERRTNKQMEAIPWQG